MSGWEKFPAANRAKFSNSTLAFLSRFPADWPEAEYLPFAVAPTPANVSSTDQYLVLGAALLTTSSRGNVTIRSADTSDPPVIDLNFLLDRGDAEQAVQAFRRLRDVAAASGMVIEEFLPGRSVQTDDQILQWLRDNMGIIYHASCSCEFHHPFSPFKGLQRLDSQGGLGTAHRGDFKHVNLLTSIVGAMGSDNDPLAVLDSHARVRGVTGLRVVDASSFPSCPPGHPQSAVCKSCASQTNFRVLSSPYLLTVFFTDMFAEKIAHYILNDE